MWLSRLFAILLALVPAAFGQFDAAPAPRVLSAEAFLSADKLVAGQPYRLAVVVTLHAPWHINAHHVNDPGQIPTELVVRPPPHMSVERVEYPPGKTMKAAWADGPVSLYEGKIIIHVSGKVDAHAAPGPVAFEADLKYQACDDKVCMAPTTLPVVVKAEIAPAGYVSAPAHRDLFPATSGPAQEENSIARLVSERGWTIALLFLFFGGLALNLTPCVYPMIGITVSYFGGRTGEGGMARAFAHALAYFLGIVITYSVLGLVAALTGAVFGAALQSPVVLIGIAVLLVALALSMFGLYELQPPQALMQRAAGMSSKAGYLGVFFLGATVGVIAAPCIAPILVALLAFVGQRGDPWLGWWLFFVLACGLGSPYVVLGTFSGLLARMPRAGMWMVWVKRIFGAGLIAVAVWIVSPLWSSAKGGVEWTPFSDEALEAAVAANKPVVIDFTAAWCGPCVRMEKTTFRNAKVMELSKDFVMLKADMTLADDPAAEALRKRFQVVGFPTIIFLAGNGVEHRSLRGEQYLNAKEFLSRMEQAARLPAPPTTR